MGMPIQVLDASMSTTTEQVAEGSFCWNVAEA
jgi:hypothetical protein